MLRSIRSVSNHNMKHAILSRFETTQCLAQKQKTYKAKMKIHFLVVYMKESSRKVEESFTKFNFTTIPNLLTSKLNSIQWKMDSEDVKIFLLLQFIILNCERKEETFFMIDSITIICSHFGFLFNFASEVIFI